MKRCIEKPYGFGYETKKVNDITLWSRSHHQIDSSLSLKCFQSSGNKTGKRLEINSQTSSRNSFQLFNQLWRSVGALTIFGRGSWGNILSALVNNTNWYAPVKLLKIGDLVFIVGEKNVRGSWPRGIVAEVMYGNDRTVRSAMIKTSDRLYTRPTAKLAIIDVRECQSDQN